MVFGKELSDSNSLADPYLLGANTAAAVSASPGPPEAAPLSADNQPNNISVQDFRRLRSRLLYSGLAFSKTDDKLKNNTSVVLLLEWRGRRLLFAGDAEWQDAGVQEDRRNSTWDIMLNSAEIKNVLLQPLDFLKVGHHGSRNGTPFKDDGREHILKSMLSPDRTNIVVSTVTGVHGEENPVPCAKLMKLLGALACNKRRYADSPVEDADELDLRKVDQPQRTDLEELAADETVPCVKVTIPAV